MTKPKLLFLSQTLPYPPDSGAKARTYQVLRQLAIQFEITALCFYRRAEFAVDQEVEKAVAGLSDVATVEVFPIPQEQSRSRWFKDHLVSLIGRRVYTVGVFDSARFGKRLAGALRSRAFDLAYADSLDLSRWFDRLGEVPLVCNHHDAQSVLLARRAALEPNPIHRWYLHHQSELMAREERTWCGRVALNAVVSEVDRSHLIRQAPGAAVIVVPNGVDLAYYRPSSGEESGVLFVGASTWAPNRDAMNYFAEAILPELRHRQPGVAVRWVGRISSDDAVALKPHRIESAGHVPDTRPWLAAAACCIAPIRIGGGTRIKILEAWAMGKAVVSTSIGCEGLAARDDDNLLIRDEPASFAEAIDQVLRDPALRGRLGEAGRQTVERHYGWTAIGRAMNDAYLAIARLG